MTVRFAGLCLRAGGACLTLALCWPPILARAEAPSVLIPFAIPAQPLSQALVAYSRASGMTVLVDSGLTEGRQAPALDGRYTAGDALRRLLAGSPLSIRYASEYSFTLVADPRPARLGSHACATPPMPPACRPRCAASCARRPAPRPAATARWYNCGSTAMRASAR